MTNGRQFVKYIARMHSRVQQPCKFIRTKESVYIGKELTPTGLV